MKFALALAGDGKVYAVGGQTPDSPAVNTNYAGLQDTTAPSAPAITAPPNNSYDSDGAFSVQGTAEPGSIVELFEGSTSVGTATADSSDNWSITLSGVSDGSHTYTARATDAAGNVSAESSPLTVIVGQLAAPKVDSTDPDNRATGVLRSVTPTATFNTYLDPATVDDTTNIKLQRWNSRKKKWVSVAFTPSYDQDTKTLKVTPASILGSSKRYRVTLRTGITSLDGTPLASEYRWTFRTGST